MSDLGFVYKLIAIIFSLLMLGNAYLFSKVSGTWFLPGSILSVFWFFMTFFGLIFLFSAPAHPLALAYIFMCIFSFSISSVLFDWKKALIANQQKVGLSSLYFNNSFLKLTFTGLQFLVIVILIQNMLNQGISFNDIIFDFFKSSGKYSSIRYSGEVESTIYSRLIFTFSYIGVVLGGLIYATQAPSKFKAFILFWSFFPSVIIMLTQSAKGAFFLSLAFFFSSILVVRLFNNDLNLMNKDTGKNVIKISLIVLPLVILSFMSRGLTDADTDYIIWKLSSYLASYSFGHIYTFSDWFGWYLGDESILTYAHNNISLGFYNFIALFEILGHSIEVPRGIFDEYYIYNGFLKSNIYSIFRGMVLDFGILGSFIYMLILGFLFHLGFYVLLVSKKPALSIVNFVFLIAFVYQTYIISIFIYKTTYLVIILMCLIFALNKLIVVGKLKKIKQKENY
jgi:oligosaccharide repeat unit polymerase